VRLQLIEPRLDRDDRIGAQAEHPHPRVAGWALVGDDAGLEQHSQVPAHPRPGDTGRIRNLARPPGSLAQQLHHPASSRVGESLEHRTDVVHHRANISQNHEYLSILLRIVVRH
jgi:hypothetical protein